MKHFLFTIVSVFVLFLSVFAFSFAAENVPVIYPPERVELQQQRDNLVLVFWEKPRKGTFEGFSIYRSTKKGVLGKRIGKSKRDQMFFRDTRVVVGKTYFYRVRTIARGKESKNSKRIALKIEPFARGLKSPPIPPPTYTNQLTDEQMQNFLQTPLLQTIVEEKIVVAVNEDFAQRYPKWKKGTEETIDFVNSVLAKNTKKRLRIERYMTYPDTPPDKILETFNIIRSDSAYLFSNSSDKSSYGGMTLFFYIKPSIGMPAASNASLVSENGKNFGNVQIFENDDAATLSSSSLRLDEDIPATAREVDALNIRHRKKRNQSTVLHEIGHALGLAHPDWYDFWVDDLTGELPKLDLKPFSPVTLYPDDPMNHNPLTTEHRFSDLNARLIDRNSLLQLTGWQIGALVPKKTIVRVKDENGNAVAGASVKVFGVDKEIENSFVQQKHAKEYFHLRQTVQTNDRDEVEIKQPRGEFETENGINFFIEILKVAKDGKIGGTYLDTIMLQKARILDGLETFVIDIVIR